MQLLLLWTEIKPLRKEQSVLTQRFKVAFTKENYFSCVLIFFSFSELYKIVHESGRVEKGFWKEERCSNAQSGEEWNVWEMESGVTGL